MVTIERLTKKDIPEKKHRGLHHPPPPCAGDGKLEAECHFNDGMFDD